MIRAAPVHVTVRDTLSPRLLRARVSCLRAQAWCDAIGREPAAVAWAEVMDALYTPVSEVPPVGRS